MAIAVVDFKNGITFTGAAGGDAPVFTVLGGRYAVAVAGTWNSGTATLEVLMPDGTTYLAVLTAFTADGSAIVDLPANTYKFAFATVTTVQGFVLPVHYPET